MKQDTVSACSDFFITMKKQLRNSEIRDIIKKLNQDYRVGDVIHQNARVELMDNKVLLVDNEPLFLRHEGRWVPTCKFLQTNQILKFIVVDKGAVRFVAGGAEIFRPGIIEIDEKIEKDEVISVVEETHRRVIAIGKALQSGAEMKLLKQGPMVQNLHYVGDAIWNI